MSFPFFLLDFLVRLADNQVYGWMHGVLNTDNISVLGLTIDYGPFAFMDVWDEQHICSKSPHTSYISYQVPLLHDLVAQSKEAS